MNDPVQSSGGGTKLPWRTLGWCGAVVLLAVPFVAMQMQAPGVNWMLSDFIFAGILFAVLGGLAELGVRLAPNRFYRAGFFLGLLGIFLVTWVNLAVGIVGSEDNPATNLFFAALLVGIVGAAVARLRAKGLSIAMFATAVCMWLAFAVAAADPADESLVPHLREFAGTSLFACLFVASGLLFRRAATDQSSSSS